MPRAGLLVAAACTALGARAQDEATVVSPGADSVAVTIYRDDLALITETRTVTLPAAPVTLVLDGVADTLLPESAVIADAGRPPVESNFTFDALTPKSLLEKSIGETVAITRTNPVTGTVTRAQATILSAGEGVLLRIGDGTEALYCSGLPERLELREVPRDLLAKPQLALRLAAGDAGTRTVKVSYLAHGFAWSSDYVAHLDERGRRLRLEGWATLTNATGTPFAQALVQVVAGNLNILAAGEGGSAGEPVFARAGETDVDARARVAQERAASEVALLRDCFATQVPVPLPSADVVRFALASRAQAAGVEEITVTGAARAAVREELGDYQLYRIPWPTDLAARQTKQVLFLDEPDVSVERLYSFRLPTFADPPDADVVAPSLVVRFDNTERAGLGEPLPRGVVRVLEPYGGGEVFAGEAAMSDKPVGLPVELTIARALNVSLETTIAREPGAGDPCEGPIVVTAEHVAVNNKGVPVDLEIRHSIAGTRDARVVDSSRAMRPKYGDYAWRFTLRAGSRSVLTYALTALTGTIDAACGPSPR